MGRRQIEGTVANWRAHSAGIVDILDVMAIVRCGSPFGEGSLLASLFLGLTLSACGGGSGEVPGPDASVPDVGAEAALDAGADATREVEADSAVDSPFEATVDVTVPDAPLSLDPPEGVAQSSAFALGISSGDVTTSTVVLWTRYSGKAKLVVDLWKMSGTDYASRAASVVAEVKDGGYVHVDVSGLEPGQFYRYAFFEMDGANRQGRSVVGRFRAAIAENALEPLVVGAVSCTKNERDFSTLVRASERTDMDMFLLLGDIIYADEVPGQSSAVTLEDYRNRWAQNLSTVGYKQLLARTSIYATWDDHEVRDNYNPETIDPKLIQAGRTTFFENMPVRHSAEDYDRVWRKFRWGKTAEIFVLDSRSERKPSTRKDDNAQYLSKKQMEWLKDGLSSTPAYFKVIMNSVPITDFPGLFDVQAEDRWEGYDAARNDILNFIESNKIKGVVWISGDFHLGTIAHASKSGLGASQLEFLVGPGAQAGNVLAGTLNSPQFDWASSEDSYSLMTFDPVKKLVTIAYYDKDGKELVKKSYDR